MNLRHSCKYELNMYKITFFKGIRRSNMKYDIMFTDMSKKNPF